MELIDAIRRRKTAYKTETGKKPSIVFMTETERQVLEEYLAKKMTSKKYDRQTLKEIPFKLPFETGTILNMIIKQTETPGFHLAD